MSDIYCQFNHLHVENDIGESANDIHFLLHKGETLFLLGERDSGRSVFCDYLLGKARKVRGNIYQGDKKIHSTSLQENIIFVSEKNYLDQAFGKISILDYLFLIKPTFSSVLWNPNKQNELAEELLSFVGLDKSITTWLNELNHSERILLNLAKAKAENATLVLIEDDFENIYEDDLKRIAVIIEKFKEEGITFIVNTNGLYGIKELSDRCAIFVNHTLTRIVENKDNNALLEVENALYKEIIELPQTNLSQESEEIFRVDNFILEDGKSFTFSLYEREIISLIDENYAEINQLFETLVGRKNTGAKLYLQKKELKTGWNKNIVKNPIVGIDSLSMNRLFPQLSVGENLAIPSYHKLRKGSEILSPSILNGAYLEWQKQHPEASKSIRQMSRAERLSLQLESWWIFHPKVIIFLEPFLHMDQQGRGVIAQYFTKFKERGTAIIVLTGSRSNYLGDDVIALEDKLFDRVLQM